MTKEDARSGHVKKETMIVVACICLGAGFLGGIAFGVYKSGPAIPAVQATGPMPATAGSPVQEPTLEQAHLIHSLMQKTETDPRDVDAWTQLGNAYFDANQYENAIGAYQQSLALAPDDPHVWTDVGVMYRRSNQPEKAVESFDRAISVDPDHETARFNKGIVLMHDLNDLEGAVQAWRELVKINPDAATPGGQSIKEMLEKLSAGR